VTASEDLEDRLDALAQAIGLEGTKLLKGALHAEFTHICRLAREDEREVIRRAMQGMDTKQLRQQLKEEEQLRKAAEVTAEVLQDQMRIVGERTQELQGKNEALESMDSQLREKIAARDADIVKLKEAVHDANLRTRAEETEKLKILDRLRRKEAEMNKAHETVKALTSQLQQLGAECDSLQAQVAELKDIYHKERQKGDATLETCEQLKAQMRVMKRNVQYQMPEEFRRVSQRVEELEKTNRLLAAKVKQLETGDDDSGMTLQSAIFRVSELTIENKAATERLESLHAQKEAAEKKHLAELRLLSQRGKALFEQKVGATLQQHAEEDSRAALKVKMQSLEKDLAALRRRNTELLSQVHALDDAKGVADKAARNAISQAKELEERLQLLGNLHKLDLGKMQFAESARTEDDIDRIFATEMSGNTTARHISRPPSGSSSRPASNLTSHPSSRPPSGKLLPSRPTSVAESKSHAYRASSASSASSQTPAAAAPPSFPPSAFSRATSEGGETPRGGGVNASKPSDSIRGARPRPASASRITRASNLVQEHAYDDHDPRQGGGKGGGGVRPPAGGRILRPASAAAGTAGGVGGVRIGCVREGAGGVGGRHGIFILFILRGWRWIVVVAVLGKERAEQGR